MMKKITIAFFCLLFLCACSPARSSLKKETSFLGYITDEEQNMVLLLNTEINITTVNSQYKEKLISTAEKETTKYHKLLDSHHYYLNEKNQRINNIKVLNDNIDNGPIKVDPIIIDALSEAIKLTKLTKGYFNISLGDLSSLYSDKLLPYDSYNEDPKQEDIEQKVQGIIKADDLEKCIIINKEKNEVELKSLNYSYTLDLGAFSKGYILDKVYDALLQYNTSFLLTAGSSSIITYKAPDEDIKWNIAIKRPESASESLFGFRYDNGAVSTSGDYENYYFLDDGTRRHHILNPYTGYSENYYRSNTLLSTNACVIDALSTALFNVEDKETRIEIINNIKNYYNINIDYCFVKENENVIMNEGFNNSLIDEFTSNKIESVTIE